MKYISHNQAVKKEIDKGIRRTVACVLSFLLLLGNFSGFYVKAQASNTFYLDTVNGTELGDGSQGNPYKYLSSALENADADTIIILLGGAITSDVITAPEGFASFSQDDILAIETPDAPAESPEGTPDVPAESPEGTPDVPVESPEVTPDVPAESPEVTPDVPVESPEGTPDVPVETPEGAPDVPAETPEGAPDVPAETPEGTIDAVIPQSFAEGRQLTASSVGIHSQQLMVKQYTSEKMVYIPNTTPNIKNIENTPKSNIVMDFKGVTIYRDESYNGAIIEVRQGESVTLTNVNLDSSGKSESAITVNAAGNLIIDNGVTALNNPVISLGESGALTAVAQPQGVFVLKLDYLVSAGDIIVESTVDVSASFILNSTESEMKSLQRLENGNLVLFEKLDIVYIDFKDGNDEFTGKDSQTALKTLDIALQRAKDIAKIRMVGNESMVINTSMTIDGDIYGDKDITLERDVNISTPIIVVKKADDDTAQDPITLTVKNITISGEDMALVPPNTPATAVFDIKDYGILVIDSEIKTEHKPVIAVTQEYAIEAKHEIVSGVISVRPDALLRVNGKGIIRNNIDKTPDIYESFVIEEILETTYILQPLLEKNGSLEINEIGYRVYFDPLATNTNSGNQPNIPIKNIRDAVDAANKTNATIVTLNGPYTISGITIGPDTDRGLSLIRDKDYNNHIFTIPDTQGLSFQNITLDAQDKADKTLITAGAVSNVIFGNGISTKNQPIIKLSDSAVINVEKPFLNASKFYIDTTYSGKPGRIIVTNNSASQDISSYFELVQKMQDDGYIIKNVGKDIGLFKDENIVYLNPINGDNANTGDTPTTAIKTIEEAIARVGTRGEIIILEGSVTISGNVEINPGENTNIKISRYPGEPGKQGYTSAIFELSANSSLTLKNLTLDAGAQEPSMIIGVNAGSTLALENVKNVSANNGLITMAATSNPIELISVPVGDADDIYFNLFSPAITVGSQTRKLVANKSTTDNLSDYFIADTELTKPDVENEIFSFSRELYLRKRVYYKGVMYVNNISGNDTNDGTSPNLAVKTFKRAVEVINSMRNDDLLPDADSFGNNRVMTVCGVFNVEENGFLEKALDDESFTIKRGKYSNGTDGTNGNLPFEGPMFNIQKGAHKNSGLKNLNIDNSSSNLPVITINSSDSASLLEFTVDNCKIDAGDGVAMTNLYNSAMIEQTNVNNLNIYLKNSVITTTNDYAVVLTSNYYENQFANSSKLTDCNIYIDENVYITSSQDKKGAIVLDGPDHDLIFTAAPPDDAVYRIDSLARQGVNKKLYPQLNRGNIVAYAPQGVALLGKNFEIITAGYVHSSYKNSIYIYEDDAVFVDNSHGNGNDTAGDGTINKPYLSIEKGVNAAKTRSGKLGSGLVYLLSSVNVNNTVNINGNSVVKILRFNHLMNDYTNATAADPGNMFIVNANGRLTISNIDIDAYFYGSHTFVNKSELYYLNEYTTPIYINKNGEATLNNATVQNSYYRGVHVNGGKFTMTNQAAVKNNSGFSNSDTTFGGGGVYMSGGEFNLAGGKVENNGHQSAVLDADFRSVSYPVGGVMGYVYIGGGVLVSNGAKMNITDGSVSKNKASMFGGGIYVTVGEVNLSGTGEISDNSCNSQTSVSGGGIYFAQGQSVTPSENIFNMSGGTIQKNNVSFTNSGANGINYNINLSGSAVFMGANSSFNLSGGKIIQNYSKIDIVHNNGSSNYTSTGAVHLSSQAKMVMTNAEISGNEIIYQRSGDNRGTENFNYKAEQLYNEGIFDFMSGTIKGQDEAHSRPDADNYAAPKKPVIGTVSEHGSHNSSYMNLWNAANIYSSKGTAPLLYLLNSLRAPVVLMESLTRGQEYNVFLTSLMGSKILIDGNTNGVGASDANFILSNDAVANGLGLVVRKNATGAKKDDIWVEAQLIYIDGIKGNDSNNGTSPYGDAVKTFARAKELLIAKKATQIIIVDTITITGDEAWSFADVPDYAIMNPRLIRMDGLNKNLVIVGTQAAPNASLTLSDVNIDGNKLASGNTGFSAVTVDYNAKLNIKTGANITNNKSYAVRQLRTSTILMTGGLVNNSGNGVFFDGSKTINTFCTFKMNGGEISDNAGFGIITGEADVDFELWADASVKRNIGGIYLRGAVDNIGNPSQALRPKTKVNIHDSKGITENIGKDANDRDAVRVYYVAELKIKDSTIANNNSFRGVYVQNTPSVEIDNVIIKNNTGAGLIAQNIATNWQSATAGIHPVKLMSVTVKNCTITQNTKTGLQLRQEFKDNRPEYPHVNVGSMEVVVENNIIDGNVTETDINGNRINDPRNLAGLMIHNTKSAIVKNNTVNDNVHGVYMFGCTDVTASGLNISNHNTYNNSGYGQGGLILRNINDFKLQSGTITNNVRGIDIHEDIPINGKYSFSKDVISTKNTNTSTAPVLHSVGTGMSITSTNITIPTVNYDGEISHNIHSASRYGGSGVFLQLLGGGTLTLGENSAVSYNKSTNINSAGSAVHIFAGKVISKGKIEHNASARGGAIFLDNTSCEFTMDGGSINNNIARAQSNVTQDGQGGAIYMQNGNVIINNGVISDNIAQDFAAAAQAGNATTRQGNGGAIHINSGTVTMNGGAIENNNAISTAKMANVQSDYNRGNGGGIYVYNSNAIFTLNDGIIKNNVSSGKNDNTVRNNQGNGGNLYIYSGTVNIRGGNISGGKSTMDGTFTGKYGQTMVGDNVNSGGIHLSALGSGKNNLNIQENKAVINDIIFLQNRIDAVEYNDISVTIDGPITNRDNKIYLYSVSDKIGQVLVKPDGNLVRDVSSYISIFKLVLKKDATVTRTIEKYKTTLVLGQAVFINSRATGAGTGANPTDAYKSLNDIGITNALGAGATIYVSGPVYVDTSVSLTSGSPYSKFVRYIGFDVNDVAYTPYLGDLFTINPGVAISFNALNKNEIGIVGAEIGGVNGRLITISQGATLLLNGNITINENSNSIVQTGAGILQNGNLEIKGTPIIYDEIYLGAGKDIAVLDTALNSLAKLYKINMVDPYIGRVVARYPAKTNTTPEIIPPNSKYILVENNPELLRYSVGSKDNTVILSGLLVRIAADNRDAVYAVMEHLGVTLRNIAVESTAFQTGHFKSGVNERLYYYIPYGNYSVNLTPPIGYAYDVSVDSQSGRTIWDAAKNQIIFGKGNDSEYNMVIVNITIKTATPEIDWGERTLTTTK